MTTPPHAKAILAAAGLNPSTATARAVILVISGMGLREAAREVGVDAAAVSRAYARVRKHLHVTHCPTCGKRL